MIASTPAPPYYAVIFTSLRSVGDNGYDQMSEKMMNMAQEQDGFLGIESVRQELGITISYWRDLQSIQKWRDNADHKFAREKGRKIWYKSFTTRIAKVERDYSFTGNNVE